MLLDTLRPAVENNFDTHSAFSTQNYSEQVHDEEIVAAVLSVFCNLAFKNGKCYTLELDTCHLAFHETIGRWTRIFYRTIYSVYRSADESCVQRLIANELASKKDC